MAAGAVGASGGADEFDVTEDDRDVCLEEVLGLRKIEPDRPVRFGACAIELVFWRLCAAPTAAVDEPFMMLCDS